MTLNEIKTAIELEQSGKSLEFREKGTVEWRHGKIEAILNARVISNFDCREKPTPTRIPLTRADFNGIPVVWLKSNHGRETLVLEICTSRLYVMNQQFEGLTFDNLLDEWQYSADRINWKPCWKEQ